MTDVVLWHIPVSHYNEKARWALAYKGVEHERRAPQPPLHMAVALALTRGRHKTFPVLGLNGQRIGDSTAIIAALEQRFTKPPLYPADDGLRRRALELEEFFDEQLGPNIRLLVWHEVTHDRERLEEFAVQQVGGSLPGAGRVVAGGVRTYINLRFGVKDPEAAELARGRVLAALDRLEEELGDGDYLAGDSFSVADLTAAALFYPLVLPPEGPRVLTRLPDSLERFREPLKQRRGYRWVEEMFRRHRRPAG